MSFKSVHALYEGTFSVGTDKEFIPIQKDEQPRKGSLKLSIHPFLIKESGRNILFDAGIGDLLGSNTTIETMLANLANHSVSEYEITDIFISHLHYDHFAGLAHRYNGYWELTFSKADIWVSENGWNKLLGSVENEHEIIRDFVHFLDLKGNLNLLKAEDNPVPHIQTKTIGGHTEHHQAFFYSNNGNNYLMAGDVIGRRIAINRNFTAKFDYQPKKSMQARTELKKKAYEENYTILAYHETDHPIFKLCDFDKKKGYTIKNLS